MINKANIAVIILAAGASSRLGHPKQLVEFQGKTLLQHILDIGDSLDFDSKIVILGANSEEIKKTLNIGNFELLHNEHWEEGMASSIRKALESLEKKKPEHVMILLSDQPMITKEHLENLIKNQLKGASEATFTKYEGEPGAPAIFSKKLFPGLMELKGDQGAKKLIYQEDLEFGVVLFEKGNFDVDTAEDVEKLKAQEKK